MMEKNNMDRKNEAIMVIIMKVLLVDLMIHGNQMMTYISHKMYKIVILADFLKEWNFQGIWDMICHLILVNFQMVANLKKQILVIFLVVNNSNFMMVVDLEISKMVGLMKITKDNNIMTDGDKKINLQGSPLKKCHRKMILIFKHKMNYDIY